jgi:hypothetical protein
MLVARTGSFSDLVLPIAGEVAIPRLFQLDKGKRPEWPASRQTWAGRRLRQLAETPFDIARLPALVAYVKWHTDHCGIPYARRIFKRATRVPGLH